MRNFPMLIAAVAVVAAPAFAKPPREELPVPADLFAELSSDPFDEQAITAAAAYPLGTVQNPVRVGGPEGERAYLARLRCADGSAPMIGRRGSAGVGAFGSITASYDLDCGNVAPGKLELVMDMYHSEHREGRAPAGLTISR
jgi:hypothetical protein